MSDEAKKIEKSDEEWRALLTPEQYQITRQAGTEPAFSGKYNDSKEPGVFHCVCCGAPLFTSDEKFDSGTGWPSFWTPVSEDAVETHVDRAYGMVRTEVVCARCVPISGMFFQTALRPPVSAFA